MRRNILRSLSIGLAVVALGSVTWLAQAVERKGNTKPAPQPLELFAAMKNGDIDVKFIAKNDSAGQLIVKNKTKQPVSIQLPKAFAATPVLAQIGGGGTRGGGGSNTNNGNQNQSMGGGMMGGGGMGGGGMMGGGGFNIAPEAIGKLSMPIVCLEHGKKDPTAKVPYEIKPIEQYTKDPNLQELCAMVGSGQLPQHAAQAAAWHIANDMSWSDLASKQRSEIGQPDRPYFSQQELQAATMIAAEAKRLADARPTDNKSPTSDEERYSSSTKPQLR